VAVSAKIGGTVITDISWSSGGGRSLFSFFRQDLSPKLKQYERLVILRTLSKIGLAAIRIGFLIGAPEW
jgi:histidinol-phosphate aminotransferase